MTTDDKITAVSWSETQHNHDYATLDALRSTGEHVFKNLSLYPFKDECQRCNDELRYLREALRNLLVLHPAVVTSLKAWEYNDDIRRRRRFTERKSYETRCPTST